MVASEPRVGWPPPLGTSRGGFSLTGPEVRGAMDTTYDRGPRLCRRASWRVGALTGAIFGLSDKCQQINVLDIGISARRAASD